MSDRIPMRDARWEFHDVQYPDGFTERVRERAAPALRGLTNRGGKYVLLSHIGKALGRHPSMAAAKAQENAINMAKARKAGHKLPPPTRRNP